MTDPVFGPAPEQTPDPELVQLLTPEGERVHHPGFDLEFTPDQLRGFYRDMTLVRRLDIEATALQRHGELGLWAQLLGQEAAQIGAGRALAPQDFVFPTYREHGVAWCRGVDPVRLLSLFRGVDQGSWDPHETNFGLYTIVIGAQTLHATGYAMGVQRDGAVGTGDPTRDTAVVAHFGDGASSQGDVNEAFVFAASYNAPVVFFCQNNQWAISEPFERQSRIPLYRRAHGFGFPGIRVDGNDVLACMAAAGAGFFAEDVWVGWAVYCALVPVLEFVRYRVLNIPLLHNVDPKKLQIFERVTPLEFAAYYDTRRWIRYASLATGLLVGGLIGLVFPSVALQVFCGTYVVTTLTGIFYVRRLKIARPRICYRDDSVLLYHRPFPAPGHMSLSQYAAAKAAGLHPWGPIDPRAP